MVPAPGSGPPRGSRHVAKRKTEAGARFMDFQISPDDRVGATPKGRGKAATTKAKSKPAGKAGGRGRVEPGFSESGDVFVDTEQDTRSRGRKPRAKAKTARGRREKKPLTLGRVVMRLIGLGFVLAIWGVIAVGGIVGYYAMQLPRRTAGRSPTVRPISGSSPPTAS